ncbi:MAG: hypothetical protein ACKVTZ_14830 [Bacteroidia bacterium]
MNIIRKISLAFLVFALCVPLSCSEQFNINAPYKEIWVVYGILSLSDSVQYIRVSKAYQVEGDAYEYAKENDLSVKGLRVLLRQGDKIWQARQIDSIPKEEGIFYPYTTAYKFNTAKGDSALIPNRRYELIIQQPNDSSFELRAHTTLPHPPTLQKPSIQRIDNQYCLDYLTVEDSISVAFVGREFGAMFPGNGYTLTLLLDYYENTTKKRFIWREGSLYSPKNPTVSGAFTIAPNVIPNSFTSLVADTAKSYTYQNQPTCATELSSLTKVAKVEVAALDSFLWTYYIINTPNYFTLSTVKPIYTNLKGTAACIGLFGSTSKTQVPFALTACGEYKMRLNKTLPPPDCP